MTFINPFTVKCGQRQISTKIPNFIFYSFDKQIASCESTDRELSFEWSHHRISSTHSKGRVTLQNSIKHFGSERVRFIPYSSYIQRTKRSNYASSSRLQEYENNGNSETVKQKSGCGRFREVVEHGRSIAKT